MDTGKLSAICGKHRTSARRSSDARAGYSARDCQVNSPGARTQSCICWTFETGAAADAREPILGNLLVNFRSHAFDGCPPNLQISSAQLCRRLKVPPPPSSWISYPAPKSPRQGNGSRNFLETLTKTRKSAGAGTAARAAGWRNTIKDTSKDGRRAAGGLRGKRSGQRPI